MARPTKYQELFATQAKKLCRLGATNEELADFFEVAVSTIYEWQLKQESFSEALKGGKLLADAEVADKLYHRALGYTHTGHNIMPVPTANSTDEWEQLAKQNQDGLLKRDE